MTNPLPSPLISPIRSPLPPNFQIYNKKPSIDNVWSATFPLLNNLGVPSQGFDLKIQSHGSLASS
jgi:hypothetical protein